MKYESVQVGMESVIYELWGTVHYSLKFKTSKLLETIIYTLPDGQVAAKLGKSWF